MSSKQQNNRRKNDSFNYDFSKPDEGGDEFISCVIRKGEKSED